jgi:hypothetical protein
VGFTAAANDDSLLLAVDATAASFSGGEMQSVIQTDAPKYRRSGRANSVPKYGRFAACVTADEFPALAHEKSHPGRWL